MRILRKTGDVPTRSLWQKIKDVALTDVAVLARGGVATGSLASLEQLLIESDFGVPVALRLVEHIEEEARRGTIRTDDEFRESLVAAIEAALRAGNSDPALRRANRPPTIMLLAGINGAGKTTAAGKLAHRFRREGRSVLLAAGDTFRAGAIDQLRIWAERTGADFVGANPGADPASGAFQAIDRAILKNIDTVIVDTAGRLHTSQSLMTELAKVATVVKKRLPGAPDETLLVLDGTIGQNAVQQAKQFATAVPVSGLIVTKVDGSAKGGIVVAVHEAIDVPVKLLGVGESADDLVPFDPASFARQLVES